MRLTFVANEGAADLPPKITFHPSGPLFVVHAPSGPQTATLFEMICAAKERIGAYGVGGSVLWPAGRPRVRVTLGLALDEEEMEFAALGEPHVEISCTLGGPEAREAEPIPAGINALLKRARRASGVFELVPAERSLVGSPPGGGIPGRVADMLRLSTHVKKYAGIPGLLVDLARDKGSAFDTFCRAFDALSPSTKCLGIRRRAETVELIFQRGRRAIGFGELGLDEHQYVLFAGLAAARSFERSVILVDAPELHLSERAARDLVGALPDVMGLNNQILFGTRSLAVSESMTANRVQRLD